MGRRTKKEMELLDEKIRPLYERGIGCRIIGNVLDENPVIVFKRVRKMGIIRQRSEVHQYPLLSDSENRIPFSNSVSSSELRRSSIGIAIRWFLERGYMASLPVEPVVYDLLVESDNGFQRIQIKTTNVRAECTPHWLVKIARRPYFAKANLNASGKRKTVPYSKADIDIFFIVTGDSECFLIPVEVTQNRLNLTLDSRFDPYKF